MTEQDQINELKLQLATLTSQFETLKNVMGHHFSTLANEVNYGGHVSAPPLCSKCGLAFYPGAVCASGLFESDCGLGIGQPEQPISVTPTRDGRFS